MQVGGGWEKVIVRGEVPSAAGHGVSPVTVAPAIVLGSGVSVVVGRFESIVVVESAKGSIVVVVAVAALSSVPTNLISPKSTSAATGISSRYIPLRLRFSVRAWRASSSKR